MLDPKSQQRSVLLVGGGIVTVGIGLFLLFVAFNGGTAAHMAGGPTKSLDLMIPISCLVMLGGIISVVVGIFSGLGRVHKQSSAQEQQILPGAQIICRFALDSRREMVFDTGMMLDEFQRYVQIQFADGRKGEFKTHVSVWDNCPDGMKGTAIIQGDWLGAFTPVVAGRG